MNKISPVYNITPDYDNKGQLKQESMVVIRPYIRYGEFARGFTSDGHNVNLRLGGQFVKSITTNPQQVLRTSLYKIDKVIEKRNPFFHGELIYTVTFSKFVGDSETPAQAGTLGKITKGQKLVTLSLEDEDGILYGIGVAPLHYERRKRETQLGQLVLPYGVVNQNGREIALGGYEIITPQQKKQAKPLSLNAA